MVLLRAMQQTQGFLVELREGDHARWYWACCDERGEQRLDMGRAMAGLRGHMAVAGHDALAT